MSQRGTGGVVDCGALEEDDPVTCETLAFLGEHTGEHGGPVINLQCVAGGCASGQPSERLRTEQAPARGAGAFKGRPET